MTWKVDKTFDYFSFNWVSTVQHTYLRTWHILRLCNLDEGKSISSDNLTWDKVINESSIPPKYVTHRQNWRVSRPVSSETCSYIYYVCLDQFFSFYNYWTLHHITYRIYLVYQNMLEIYCYIYTCTNKCMCVFLMKRR